MMPENRPPSNVSLEDLLRLKRAERPPADFWVQFEREFRTRQLAAAVEKKRWWFSLQRTFGRFAGLQLPLGATAVLAITFLTFREYRDAETPMDVPPPAAASDELSATVDAVAVPAVMDDAAIPASATVATVVTTTDSSRPKVPVVIPSRRAEITDLVPWVGPALQPGHVEAALSPSARSIAANLAAAEPEFARVLAGSPMIENRAPAVREPLAEVRSPSAARRARLLGDYTAETADYPQEDDRSVQVRERLASRLSEEQLYESVRRLGGGGDRLIVKF